MTPATPDTQSAVQESKAVLSAPAQGRKSKRRWRVALGVVVGFCGVLLVAAFLFPGGRLKAEIFVMKNGIIVHNGDDFDYGTLSVTMIKGSISSQAEVVNLGVGQYRAVEFSPRFARAGVTPDYVRVELVGDEGKWRARWREGVEGNNQESRALRKKPLPYTDWVPRREPKVPPEGWALATHGTDGETTLSLDPLSEGPSYRGRPLSKWLGLYFCDDGWAPPSQVKEVDHAVREMGTNAVSFLLRWLHHEGPRPNVARSRYAMEALGRLGKNAVPFFPELKSMLNNNTNRELAIRAFCVFEKIDGPALPVLAEAAEEEEHLIRSLIVGHLCHHGSGPHREAVLPVLKRLTQDPDPAIQAWAWNIINRIPMGGIPPAYSYRDDRATKNMTVSYGFR